MNNFKTITKEELELGFINKEFCDFEDRIRSGNATKKELQQIDADMSKLAEIEGW